MFGWLGGERRSDDVGTRAAGSEFPIQDYAALGDGRSVALVAPDGAVAWWCVPELDARPVLIHAACTLAGDRARPIEAVR